MTINTSSPSQLRVALLDHERRSESLAASLGVWLACLRDFPETSFAMADRAETPLPVLAAIVTSSDARSRSRVAMRAGVDPELLGVLATDSDDGVVGHVASHPNTPRSALRELLSHPWQKIQDRAQERLVGGGPSGGR